MNTAFHIYGQMFFFSGNNCYVSVTKQYDETGSGSSDSWYLVSIHDLFNKLNLRPVRVVNVTKKREEVLVGVPLSNKTGLLPHFTNLELMVVSVLHIRQCRCYLSIDIVKYERFVRFEILFRRFRLRCILIETASGIVLCTQLTTLILIKNFTCTVMIRRLLV